MTRVKASASSTGDAIGTRGEKGSVFVPFLEWISKAFAMTQIIVGDPASTAELLETAPNAENVRIWPAEATPEAVDPSSSAALAARLVGFEAEMTGQEPELVLLADDSDAALAAALVATKLLIPVAAAAAASRPSTANGRLIAQLAAAYTRSA
jgi:UDP-N-acetylglucosamine 2-epimerase